MARPRTSAPSAYPKGAEADAQGKPNQQRQPKLQGGQYRHEPRGNRQQTWGPKRPKVRFRRDLIDTATQPAPQERIRTCNAPRRTDAMPCGQYAGAGTDHRGFGRCSQHGGNTERGKRLAFIEKCAADAVHEAVEEQGGLEIENALGQLYGIVAEITPDKALEAELWRTNGAVLQIQDLIQKVGPGELEMLPHGRVLKDLYEKERDRLVKISKIMIDIGFAEREVAASEVFAGTMQAVIMAVLEGLQLTPDQSTLAPQVIRRVLEIEAARLDPATVVDAVVTNRQFVDDEEPMPQAQGKRVHVPPPDPIDEADEI